MVMINLSKDTMLSIVEDYLSPNHLRPFIEAEPQLAYFLDDFEALQERFEQRADALKEDPKFDKRRARARARRDELVEDHDGVVRQIWHLVQAAQSSPDEQEAQAAEEVEILLFPEGREFLRRGAFARVSAARAIRLDTKQRETLHELGHDGSLDRLHDLRASLASQIAQALSELRQIEAEEVGAQESLRTLQREWVRLMRLFERMVAHVELEPVARAALLGHVDRAIERLRAARESAEEKEEDRLSEVTASVAASRAPPETAPL
ncbi:MAG: hypothetical protein AAFU79_01575 [Myxococcota bacterium]